MVIERPERRKIGSVLVVALLISSSGCMGLFEGSSASAGEMVIYNEDNVSHSVVIEAAGNEITRTVEANGSQTVKILDSPGNYTVNATIDDSKTLNRTTEINPGGPDGTELAGPVLVLRIESGSWAEMHESFD